MRAITIQRQGTPVADNIKVVDDWPKPEPAAGEVVVKTEAAALNHLDLWVGRGMPGIDLAYPRISGSDGAGIVDAVGTGVDESWIGQRVLLNAAMPIEAAPRPDRQPSPADITMIGEHTNGALAEYFVAPVKNVAPIGDLDPVQAVAGGLSFLTAWRMLTTRAGVRPGQWILIPGIGGGVALALLKIGRYMGCKTIVTSRHEWKLKRAAELGADFGVLDTGEDFSREVRGHTGKRGVDICADSVGKAIHLSCIKSLARQGVFVTCGCTTGPAATTDLARIFWNQLTIMGSTMGNMDEFREIIALMQTGHLEPVVDTVFEPGSGVAAFKKLETAEQFGKLVVRW